MFVVEAPSRSIGVRSEEELQHLDGEREVLKGTGEDSGWKGLNVQLTEILDVLFRILSVLPVAPSTANALILGTVKYIIVLVI